MTPLDPFTIPLHGAHLIEANAGTGKTYAITTLYVRLLLERHLTVGQILAVTYTNAATAELRRKVRARIAETLAALRGAAVEDDTVRELAARRRAEGTAAADCRHLTAALYGFDDAAICTIHGFCQRVLQEHAFESGVAFDLELVGDDRLLVDELARDFWTRELYDAPPELVRGLGKITPATLALLARKAASIPDLRLLPGADAPGGLAIAGDQGAVGVRERTLQLQIDLVGHTRAELRCRKAATQTQSFDDLLQRLDEALQGDGAEALAGKIRDRFVVALIDEFQDTDSVQYRIFERIYRHPNTALFLIGDPKQAIYAFRGADVFAYMRAKRALGGDAHTLSVNWRSSPSLVRAVNMLFGAAREQFIFPDIPFSASDAARRTRDALGGAAAGRPPLRVVFVPKAGRPTHGRQMKKGRETLSWFHAAMAAEVTRLLNSETFIGDQRITPGDVAVLCGTNIHCTDLQAQLFALGVPTVMYGDTSVFDTPEAEAVGRVLRAMADPADGAAIAAALLTPLLGLSGEALAAARADDREWDGWIERFQAWNERWTASGFTAALRRLLDEREVPARILSRPGGERCLTNVLHLAELLHAAAVEGRRGPSALVEWLQRMRADASARTTVAAESAQIRLESDTRALKLITIHKSKGLEFPVVACPFLWDGMLLHPSERAAPPFHDPSDGERLTIDLGSGQIEQHRELAKRETLAEKLRLLYVAVTRAQQLCIVAWGAFDSCETSALGYLLHQPAAGTGSALIEATRSRIRELSDPEMRAEVERVAAQSAGAIEVVDLVADPAARFQLAADDGPALRLRRMSHEVHQSWRMASFSALASADQPLPEPAEEGVDQDELAEGVAVAEADAATTLRGFPRGRRLGNLVHKLFETTDFGERDAAAMQANTLRWMPLYGIEARWADTLCAAVSDVLDTPLTADSPPLTLRQIPRNRRLDELEFIFPVALQADETPHGAVSASRLAAVFATHGAPWLAEYAARLRRLPFAALAGYMKGFIDLVFAAGDRWYLVDYKTNDLGGRCEDYRHPQLLAEMYRHHYVLQYHLYTVALHRYLAQRLPGYAYERHFGGVFYLFVRGMAPTHEPGCGIFADRPPEALIEALSNLLAQPSDVQEQQQ